MRDINITKMKHRYVKLYEQFPFIKPNKFNPIKVNFAPMRRELHLTTILTMGELNNCQNLRYHKSKQQKTKFLQNFFFQEILICKDRILNKLRFVSSRQYNI